MAADAQGQVPIFDVPVVSEGDPPNKPPKPGDQWSETVWFEDPPPGSWSHSGPGIGTVDIHARGPAGSPRFDADFTFTNPPRPSIQVSGAVPGGDGWRGKGKAKARGPKPEQDIDIEFVNPKRWG